VSEKEVTGWEKLRDDELRDCLLLINCCLGVVITEDEIRGAWGTFGEEENLVQGFGWSETVGR
jgi:hypothetical protein